MTRARCEQCQSIIVSQHRHDFVWCACHTCFVDGGSSYFRCGFDVPSSLTILYDDGTERNLALDEAAPDAE